MPAVDQDPHGVLMYNLTSNLFNAFSIDQNGNVFVANSSALDFELSPFFSLEVTITPPVDDGGANITHYNIRVRENSLQQCRNLLPQVGRGWKLVRSLKPGATAWHAATDNLAGTDTYGDLSKGIEGRSPRRSSI